MRKQPIPHRAGARPILMTDAYEVDIQVSTRKGFKTHTLVIEAASAQAALAFVRAFCRQNARMVAVNADVIEARPTVRRPGPVMTGAAEATILAALSRVDQ